MKQTNREKMEIIEKQLPLDIAQDGQGIYEGARAIIESVGPRRSKFIREKEGMECLVVSCNRKAAIVEIPSLGELLVCKMKDLKPVNSADSPPIG
jgi:hypothetical protein